MGRLVLCKAVLCCAEHLCLCLCPMPYGNALCYAYTHALCSVAYAYVYACAHLQSTMDSRALLCCAKQSHAALSFAAGKEALYCAQQCSPDNIFQIHSVVLEADLCCAQQCCAVQTTNAYTNVYALYLCPMPMSMRVLTYKTQSIVVQCCVVQRRAVLCCAE